MFQDCKATVSTANWPTFHLWHPTTSFLFYGQRQLRLCSTSFTWTGRRLRQTRSRISATQAKWGQQGFGERVCALDLVEEIWYAQRRETVQQRKWGKSVSCSIYGPEAQIFNSFVTKEKPHTDFFSLPRRRSFPSSLFLYERGVGNSYHNSQSLDGMRKGRIVSPSVLGSWPTPPLSLSNWFSLSLCVSLPPSLSLLPNSK